jgi:hypothetical protein
VQKPTDTGSRTDLRTDSREPSATQTTGPTGSGQARTPTTGDAAEQARTSQDDNAEALRKEIEQTRAEMGETTAELAARMDVPHRVKEAAMEKKAQLTEAVAEKKAQLTEAAAGKRNQLAEAAAGKRNQLAEAAAGKRNHLAEAAAETRDRVMGAATEKKNHLAGTATGSEPSRSRQAATEAAGSIAAKAEAVTEAIHGRRTQGSETVQAGDTAHAGSASSSPRSVTPGDSPAQSRQESAETRIHLAEAAAEAAERATTAISTLPGRASEAIGTLRGRTNSAINTLPDRMPDRRQRYALIGAALAMTAVVTFLIRRLRRPSRS